MDSNSKKSLDKVSVAILRLIKTVDEQFNLTDEEVDIVIHSAWNGLNKVLDKRYKSLKNSHHLNKEQ